jgi:hypothetical protein
VEGLLGGLGEDVAGVDDLLEDLAVGRLDVGEEGGLEGLDLVNVNPVAVSLNTDEEGGDDLLGLLGLVLALLEELVEADTAVELLLGGGVEVGAELGEGGDLTVLGELELHGTGDGLGGLVLGGGADAGDGKADGDGGALALVEELGLEEDLAVGNGNDVGGDVGGHVTGLGLDDGKGGEGTAALVAVHLGGALEEAGVEVEDVTGVGLAAGGTAEEEGHLAVGDGLLGEIVVEDDSVLAVVTEVLAHGGAGVGGKELEGGGIGGRGGHDDAVAHGLLLVELADELGDGGTLLADADVDAGEGLGLGLLVDDGVDGDGGLAGLAVTDDELALATADGDEGVDGLEAGEHGLRDGLAGDDAGRLDLGTAALAVVEGGPAVDGLADAVDDAAEELGADGDVDDGAGPLDGVALEDVAIVSEDDDTDVVLLEVEGHAAEAAGEDNHLSGLDVGQAVDAGDTVTDRDDGAGLGVLGGGVLGGGAADLGLEVGGQLEGLRGHGAARRLLGGSDGGPAGDLEWRK